MKERLAIETLRANSDLEGEVRPRVLTDLTDEALCFTKLVPEIITITYEKGGGVSNCDAIKFIHSESGPTSHSWTCCVSSKQ